jgi:replicative DNA helicase
MAQETIRGIEDGTELTDVIENAADLFVDATSNTKNTEVRIDEGLKEFVLNQHKDLADKLIPTYLPEIDKIIGGFEYSDLIIIAGAASMGKTSFMLRLLQNYLNQDKSIAIFSLEMSNNQLLTRVISMETGVPVKNIRYNNLDDSDWDSIHKTIGKYENKRFIMDGQTTKLTDVLTKIKKLKIKEDVDIIFIDYLQLIVDGKSKGSREQEVAKIARSLKNIAKELNIVVVALSQLSRALMQRDNKRPMLSDLRESGEIEQAADTIMFAFREEYYTMENPRDIQDAEIIIAKGRNVGTGTAYMKFKPANVKFISPEADGYELMEAENNVF